jgi:photosystem II stability/assembly factor-like uncharacterized protein
MQVTSPPSGPELDPGRDLERRVEDLEALIEEARRRSRRRRQRTAAVVLVAAAVVCGLLIGFGGHGGGTTGTTALAATRNGPGSNTNDQPLGALPHSVRFVEGFAFDSRNPRIVYLLAGGPDNSVIKTTDGGAHWQLMPKSGWAGAYQALAADPRHPGTLYVGTGVGVLKTVDGGKTWRRSVRGLFVPHVIDRNIGWVAALAIDPENSNVVYAGSNRISKSIDGGLSWKTVFSPQSTAGGLNPISVSALAVAPTHPETIYAIHANSKSGHTSIYTSTDSGTTWRTSISVPGFVHGFVTDLAVDPQHPTTVYAAVGATVLRTTDSGNSWLPIGRGLPVQAGARGQGCHCRNGVTILAIDPHRSGAVYAGVNQGGIYKTTNGGRSWREVAARSLYLRTIVGVDPQQPATVYGFGQLEYDNSPHLFRTTNAGRTWTSAP